MKDREIITPSRYDRYFTTLALMLSGGIFAILSSINIGRWSIWFDESFSAFMIKFNVADIAHWTGKDVHPPLFYWLLKGWAGLIGNSVVALRSFSVVCGVLVIVAGSFLTRKLFGRKAAYLALPLLTLSPMLVRYGMEMRMYTLATLFVFGQLLVLLAARRSNKKSWWLLYGGLAAAGMWTHYFTAVAVMAQWMWLILAFRRDGVRGRKLWAELFNLKKIFRREKSASPRVAIHGFSLSVIVAAVLYAPWLPSMMRQLLTVQDTGFWIPPIIVTTLPDVMSTTFVYETAGEALDWLALGVLALIVVLTVITVRVWRSEKDDKTSQGHLSFLLWSVIAPPLLLLIISLPPLRPAFIDRYILSAIVLTPVLGAAVIAAYWARPRGKLLAAFLYILLLGGSFYGVGEVMRVGNFNKTTNTNSNAKELMTEIAATNSQPVIADSPWVFYDVDAYATDENPVYFLNDQADDFRYGSLELLRDVPENIKDLDAFVENLDGQTVWYVSSTGGSATPPKSSENWRMQRTIIITSPFDGNQNTMATEYLVK